MTNRSGGKLVDDVRPIAAPFACGMVGRAGDSHLRVDNDDLVETLDKIFFVATNKL